MPSALWPPRIIPWRDWRFPAAGWTCAIRKCWHDWKRNRRRRESRGRSLHKIRLVNRAESVLAEQFDELRQPAFFIRAEVVVDEPTEVILAELEIVFRAAADDAVERIEPEVARLAELPPKLAVLDAAAQCPHGVNKRMIRQLQPRRTKVDDLVLVGGA